MDVNFSLDTINQTAEQLLKQYKIYSVWAFHGSLGAGKTSIISALGKQLKISDPVSSPTFSIINEYKLPDGKTVFHMDWYRLNNEEEAIQAGVEECILSGAVCWIEWPEQAPGLLPDNCLHLYIEIIDEQTRRIFSKISSG